MVFIQIVKCLFQGILVGFIAFFKSLPLYEQLSGIKDQLIAGALGVPVFIVSGIGIVLFIVRIIIKFFKSLN